MTIPRSLYVASAAGTAGNGPFSYRDIGLYFLFEKPATGYASGYVYVACLSDSVVTESMCQTYRTGVTATTANAHLILKKFTSSSALDSAYANAGTNLVAEYEKIYGNGYTCIHQATKIG